MPQEKTPKKTTRKRGTKTPVDAPLPEELATAKTAQPMDDLEPPPGGGQGNETNVNVTVEPANKDPEPTLDTTLWKILKMRQIDFKKYQRFIDQVFCPGDIGSPDIVASPDEIDACRAPLGFRRSFQRTDSYDGLKAATECFLMAQCGSLDDIWALQQLDAENDGIDFSTDPDELERFVGKYLQDLPLGTEGSKAKILPYLDRIRTKLGDMVIEDCRRDPAWDIYAAACGRNPALCERFTSPCLLELIWSYWTEQSLLVQTMNAISLRFQNRTSPRLKDPLTNLTLDPLRPLNNLIWGFIQDERNRLTVRRRAYEYDHEYGLKISGRAVGTLASADSRSAFLEAFHTLLNLVTRFFKQHDDRQIRADAFPVLNGLRDLHMVLAQGAHNQFGDLTWVARVEMMVMQYILARPEMREFLGSRMMVPYKEPWMDRVDSMKKRQGWTDTSVTHFHDLAVYGEQLLLSVRYGDWNNANSDQAFSWALAWRDQVQRYTYAYRAATGVDLTGTNTNDIQVSTAQPSILIQQRAASTRKSA